MSFNNYLVYDDYYGSRGTYASREEASKKAKELSLSRDGRPIAVYMSDRAYIAKADLETGKVFTTEISI